MARAVPIQPYESQVPVQEGMRRVIPEIRPSQVGGAIEDVGNAVNTVMRSEAAAYSAATLARTQRDWTQQFLDRQQQAEPGAPGFTPALMGDYDKYVKDQVKGAPNALAGKFLQQHLNAFGSELAQRSLHFEAGARQDHNAETAKAAIEASSTELGQDPSLFPQRLAQNQTLISQMNLEPQVKDKLNRYAENSMAAFAVKGDINRDPYKAMLALQDNTRSDYYKSLTPEQREQLQSHADQMLHQRVADAERVHNLAKQQFNDGSDSLLRKGIVMSAQGTLDAGWVTKHANALEPAALKYLYDQAGAIGGKGGKDESEPKVYADLLTRQTNGEDVRDDVNKAFFAGNLAQKDYTHLMEKSAGEIPTPYKRGANYIQTALQVSQLEPDPAKAQSLANAQREFNDWYRENSETVAKNPDAAQERAQQIVKNYQIVKADQNLLTLPVPTVGLGKGSRTNPDIPGMKKALADAMTAGMSDDQAKKEILLIKQWEASLQAAQAAAAKRKAAAEANK